MIQTKLKLRTSFKNKQTRLMMAEGAHEGEGESVVEVTGANRSSGVTIDVLMSYVPHGLQMPVPPSAVQVPAVKRAQIPPATSRIDATKSSVASVPHGLQMPVGPPRPLPVVPIPVAKHIDGNKSDEHKSGISNGAALG